MFCFKSLALISKVLFEITLSREWKTFSCSNTSKNAVQIYCYKEQFLSFCRVCPFGLPRCSDRRFFSGKWCKDKSSFWNHQIFLKEFFRNFQNLFSYRFEPYFLFEAGAKVSHFSESPKDFGTFFFKIFQNLFFTAPEQYFSLEADAKIRAFRSYFQIIRGLFFDNSSSFFHTRLSVSELVVKKF